jgi:hypothetical protein
VATPIHGQQIGVQIDASKALAKIGRMKSTLTIRDILETIGAKELRWTGLNLQKAGREPGGSPWQVMAPMTLRLRPLRTDKFHFSSPYQTLLQQSMVVEVNEATATVSVGTNARYAKEHHLGVPSRRLPSRKLVGSAESARKHALAVVKAIVAKLASEAGR